MKRLLPIVFLLSLLACNREGVESMSEPEQPQDQRLEEPQILEANIYLDDNLASRVEEAVRAGGPATKAAAFETAIDGLTILSLERIFPEAGEFEARHRKAGLHKWYTISYKAEVSATKAESSLADIPGVEAIVATRRAQIHSTPFFNDRFFSRQWDMVNDGSTSGFVEGVDVNVLPVWNNITTGDPGVVVAVMDTGVDFSHEDLSAHVDMANSWNFWANTANLEPGDHGTHVGGTIAGISNNEKGIAGIAGGDAAAGKAGSTLISCQVFNPEGKKGSGHAAALVWAADHGAVIANNSWGYHYRDDDNNYQEEEAKADCEFYLQPNEGEYADPIKSAVDYFNANAGMDVNGKQTGPMAGGVVFFSAGNDASQYAAPAPYEGIVAVGSVGPGGRVASYSNYGDWVDIAAPGGDSGFGEAGLIFSSVPGNQYDYMAGTSMACPHVSGVAALIVAACGGPGFTREMLLEKILNGTSSSIDLSGQKIGPLVDAWNAINFGDTTPPASVTTLTVSAQSNTLTAKWKVTGHDKIPAAGFLVRYSDSKADLAASTPTEMKESVFEAFYRVSAEKIGDEVSLALPDLSFETEYFVKIYAFNNNRVFSDPSAIVSAKTEKNTPPVIATDEDLSNIRIKASGTRTIVFQITDADGHDIKVTHQPGSEADTWRANPDGTYALQINGTKAPAGTYKAGILAEDKYGASDRLEVKYTILENHAPVLKKQFENVLFTSAGASFSLNLADYFSDEDDDVLTYSATNSAASSVHVTTNNGKLSGTAINSGLATIEVKATDPRGKFISTEFKVAVRTGTEEVSAYPNPVVDNLYLTNREQSTQSMSVRLVNATGGLVYEGTLNGSAFEPAVLDLSGLAPGVYSATVTFGGKEYKLTVVKK